MSVRESIVRAFLKLNIFVRIPKVEESGFISEEALENNQGADYEEELEDGIYVRVYRSRSS